MTSGPSAATLTLLEKLAVDNGFDRELPREGEWLAFASTQSPLRIWLSAPGEALFLSAFSQSNVAAALDIGTTASPILPTVAVAARIVTSLPELHRLVRRAFQLSKTLPHELLRAFEKQTATLPRSTEVERLVVQRVGQAGHFPRGTDRIRGRPLCRHRRRARAAARESHQAMGRLRQRR